jgi:hypothetical protein
VVSKARYFYCCPRQRVKLVRVWTKSLCPDGSAKLQMWFTHGPAVNILICGVGLPIAVELFLKGPIRPRKRGDHVRSSAMLPQAFDLRPPLDCHTMFLSLFSALNFENVSSVVADLSGTHALPFPASSTANSMDFLHPTVVCSYRLCHLVFMSLG